MLLLKKKNKEKTKTLSESDSNILDSKSISPSYFTLWRSYKLATAGAILQTSRFKSAGRSDTTGKYTILVDGLWLRLCTLSIPCRTGGLSFNFAGSAKSESREIRATLFTGDYCSPRPVLDLVWKRCGSS